MKLKVKYFVFLLVVSVVLISCDYGLEPPKIEQGIAGKIYYKGNQPEVITAHYLIASKVYRTFKDISEILFLVSVDSISLYDKPLPTVRTDSLDYRFKLSPAVYKYIAIAQAWGDPSVAGNWKIVGVYDLDTTTVTPTEVTVVEGIFNTDLNIYVDYNNLPPQPFEQ